MPAYTHATDTQTHTQKETVHEDKEGVWEIGARHDSGTQVYCESSSKKRGHTVVWV